MTQGELWSAGVLRVQPVREEPRQITVQLKHAASGRPKHFHDNVVALILFLSALTSINS